MGFVAEKTSNAANKEEIRANCQVEQNGKESEKQQLREGGLKDKGRPREKEERKKRRKANEILV